MYFCTTLLWMIGVTERIANVQKKGTVCRQLVDRIVTTDKVICRHLDDISSLSRGVVSQDILARLMDFTEHIMLKLYSPFNDIDDSKENIALAIEYTQTNHELKKLYRFHNFLQTVAIRESRYRKYS